MRYKHLKNANVDVSALAVGTWAIGGESYGAVNRNDSIEAIRKMVDCGVNLIDTAPCYGNGMSEKIVGEAIQGIRDKVLLSTKFGLITDIYGRGYKRDGSYKNVMREVQSSMMNLGTDHIDFYYYHKPDGITPLSETMAALNWLKKEGYISYIGFSNFSREEVEEALNYGDIDVQQPSFSMISQENRDLMTWGYSKGIDSFTYGSLGAGILTGAVREMPKFEKNDYRLTFYDFYREPKFSRAMELLTALDKIAEAHNAPVPQVAINWSTQKDFVGTALCGVRNAREAEENCAAFDWELTAEEMALLDSEMARLGLDK
ncbi:aldo/keto reductase [Anaerolentibacter hominis]|uniref:aldo/keto reductase n=1 Tax=Anaerolentibacter hominis TaxID=3079009 RepID=UPI0031B7ED35